MTTLFTRLKDQPLLTKALIIFAYGLLSFGMIWLIGAAVLDNVIAFRILEFLWFVHILVIANQISEGSSDLIALALLGLSPGLLNNLLSVVDLSR
jgi:hypothetical protein